MIDTVKFNEVQKKSRRGRNVALALTLVALVVLFYVITIIKIGAH